MSETNPQLMRKRAKASALAAVRSAECPPKNETGRVLGRQPFRSGASAGAGDRAARHAKSNADFVSRMGTVEEEADESACGTGLPIEYGHVRAADAETVLRETTELPAGAASSINAARKSGGWQ